MSHSHFNSKLALAFLVLAACTDIPEPADPAPLDIAITVYAETAISDDSMAAFSRRMQHDMGLWNDGLEAIGCPAPYRFVANLADAHMRIILRRDHWEDFPANGGGFFDGKDIYLHADSDGSWDSLVNKTWIIQAQHELGHALGLPHNMRDDSVMSTQAYVQVSPSDIEDAAKSIGCL